MHPSAVWWGGGRAGAPRFSLCLQNGTNLSPPTGSPTTNVGLTAQEAPAHTGDTAAPHGQKRSASFAGREKRNAHHRNCSSRIPPRHRRSIHRLCAGAFARDKTAHGTSPRPPRRQAKLIRHGHRSLSTRKKIRRGYSGFHEETRRNTSRIRGCFYTSPLCPEEKNL